MFLFKRRPEFEIFLELFKDICFWGAGQGEKGEANLGRGSLERVLRGF